MGRGILRRQVVEVFDLDFDFCIADLGRCGADRLAENLVELPMRLQQQEAQPIMKTTSVARPVSSTPTPPPAYPSVVSEVTSKSASEAPTGAATATEPAVADASTPATASGSSPPSSPSYPLTPADSHNDALAGLDDVQRRAAENDPEFAAALLRKKARELEEAKLACSLENKEACVMCSG